MPTANDIRPYIKEATLISLCSPQNPTGTTFSKKELESICDLVLEENARRSEKEKKVFIMYDQMYWHLTYGDIKHYNPVSLRPEMRNYTIFIDAISKVFAATGVRVGWSMGPASVINKMKSILGHVGAWAPMAEQKAVASFLGKKKERLPVDCITPEAAIYLTIKVDAVGRKTTDGKVLETQGDVTAYILNEAGLAVVPF